MHIFISCGETSGDKYAAQIITKANTKMDGIKWSANAGGFTQTAGAFLLSNIVLKSTIGFLEPLKNIPFYLWLMKKTKAYIVKKKIGAVILIDHQGFNIPLAKWCKAKNIPVISLFAPQYWIWGNQAAAIKFVNYCDKIMCVFEKEYEFYQSINSSKVVYVGHPIINLMPKSNRKETNVIGIFPGSRTQEIQHLLPTMISAIQIIAKKYPGYTFKLACASKNLLKDIETVALKSNVPIEIIFDSRQLILESYVSIVASGTITLEHALVGTPCVVCYKLNAISYYLTMKLVWKKIEEKCFGYIALPNILLEKQIIPELLQNNFQVPKLVDEVANLLKSENNNQVSKILLKINKKLDDGFSPIDKILQEISSTIL